MSNEQVANWLLREAHRRQLTTSESKWLDQYYWSYREESHCQETPQSQNMFWFCTMFLCGVAATLVVLIA